MNNEKNEFLSPLVSIIMPTHNVESYLPQCIESVINQDYKNLEIITIDNGSEDKSGTILDQYKLMDNRIKVIHQKDKGYGGAVNVGLDNATGKYIAIVETDDYAAPDMISSMIYHAERNNANIVKAGFTKHFSNGNSFRIYPPFYFYEDSLTVYPEYSIDLMLMESSIWAGLYKRDFLEKNKIRMIETKGASYQDCVFKFMIYSLTDKVIVIPNSVYNYRVMTSNSSSKSSKNWDALFINYEYIKKFLKSHKKFDAFHNAYYMNGYFDFVFHYNRIQSDYQKLFIDKAVKFYLEGCRNGVTKDNGRFCYPTTRSYYWNDVIPIINKIETLISCDAHNTLPNMKESLSKRIARLLYKTFLGKIIWRGFSSIVKRPFILNKLGLVYPESNRGNDPINTSLRMIFPKRDFFELYDSKKKTILVILPWLGVNAVTNNVEQIVKSFKEKGYELHLLIYAKSEPTLPNDSIWDKVFFKYAENPYFGVTNYTEVYPDNDHVDDWVDADFYQSVKRLDNQFDYKICFVNYLIYTKAFEFVNKKCKKLLYTHDRFYARNRNLIKSGFSSSSCWFGVNTKEEEAYALKRADLVLAIQEEDAEYFRRITNHETEVCVYPFLPSKKFIGKKPLEKSCLSVGYIASANPPNYYAIKKVIEKIKKTKVNLYIAGTIGGMFNENELPKNCNLIGLVDSLEDFYSSYDIYVNPDTFYSGFKCKTIEAMAYGSGIVCTKIAATGCSLDESYHNLESEEDCAKYLIELSELSIEERNKRLFKIIEESELKFNQFVETYSKEKLTAELLRGVE